MKPFVVLTVAVLLGVFPLRAAEPAWLTDYAAARRQAKAENKAILLNFTGSNWCGVCMKLDREVFSTAEFKEYATKQLILVKLDFPRPNNLPAHLKTQNKALSRQFGVEGYPTLVLLDSEAKPLWRTVGYRGKGPKDYIDNFDQRIKKPAKQ